MSLKSILFPPILTLALLVPGVGPASIQTQAARTLRSSQAEPNPIQIENALPGTTKWKLSKPASGGQIGGYPSRESVRPGQSISFSVSTRAATFKASIYRIGWYGGNGGRLMRTEDSMPGHDWPIPSPDPKTGLLVCQWPASFSVTIPDDWLSGMYLVKLTNAKGYQAYIPFTVVESTPTSPLLMIDTITTSEAYNWFGGRSLFANIHYSGAGASFAHRAVMVSFQRPFAYNLGAGWFVSWEIHTVRWLEEEGYYVSYANDLDVNDDPSILLGRKGIIIVGHPEFWSMAMRNGMDAAVASGVNFAAFAADTDYWQFRLAPVGSNPDGIVICYKDFKRDPIHKTQPKLATVLWRSPQVDRPESELLGAMYEDFLGNVHIYPWVVSDPTNWVFAGTGLKSGSQIPGIVGVEADAVLGGYPRPKHLHILSKSPVFTDNHLPRIANSTIYQAPSGAIVFDAGTFSWGYGLDDISQPGWFYNPDRHVPSPAIEQISRNILNRFLNGPLAT